jgi:hypothetical protein
MFCFVHKSINEIVMALKTVCKTKPVCKVTFSVAAKRQIKLRLLVNNWNSEEGA